MRFKLSEHTEFKRAIEVASLNYTLFEFTKKKGWLTIHYDRQEPALRFHRKSKTTLTVSGEWKKSDTYFITVEENRLESDDWQEIMSEFTMWLSQFEK